MGRVKGQSVFVLKETIISVGRESECQQPARVHMNSIILPKNSSFGAKSFIRHIRISHKQMNPSFDSIEMSIRLDWCSNKIVEICFRSSHALIIRVSLFPFFFTSFSSLACCIAWRCILWILVTRSAFTKYSHAHTAQADVFRCQCETIEPRYCAVLLCGTAQPDLNIDEFLLRLRDENINIFNFGLFVGD